MDSLHSSPTQNESAPKKPYTSPKLLDLGAVEELSMAGSGMLTEGQHSTDKKRKP
jgi:hypothetical protein